LRIGDTAAQPVSDSAIRIPQFTRLCHTRNVAETSAHYHAGGMMEVRRMTALMTVVQPRRHGASAEQIRAVYAVMRILAEDDRERGVAADRRVRCAACRRSRPAAGSVEYAGTLLCNGCATDYELLRIGGQVDDVAGYLGARLVATSR
jgi:hypothetical protein